MRPILVDSSVWIDFFRGVDNARVDCLLRLFPWTPIVVGDLVRG